MTDKVNPTYLASLIEMGIDEELARQVDDQNIKQTVKFDFKLFFLGFRRS